MDKSKGLDGGIGTATHVIHTWTDNAIDEWLRDFLAFNKGVEAGRAVLAAADAFMAAHFAHVFCTVCGEEIVRGERTRQEWGKVRKCDACIEAKRQAGATKFCRMCKTELRRQEAGNGRTEESVIKGWATRATCDECREINARVSRHAERMTSRAQVLPTAARAYRAALKDPTLLPRKQ